MKLKSISLLCFLAVFIIYSCKKIDANSKLEKASYFIGEWENVTPEANFKEIWKQENDSTYLASSFITIKKDTVFFENIVLQQKNDSLFYTVSIKGENKEKAVSFYMTSNENENLTFENPKHDYPNKIVYKKINNDSLVATIYGIKNGKVAKEDFPMKRKK